MSVLDIPLSITEQLDHEVLYWDPGVEYPDHMIADEHQRTMGVMATELDCYIMREYARQHPSMHVARNIRSMTFVEVNQKARGIGCTKVDVIGCLAKNIEGQVVDSWTVPCE